MNKNGNISDPNQLKKEELIIKNMIIFLSFIIVIYTLVTKLTYPPEPFLDRGIYLLFSFLVLFGSQYTKYSGTRKALTVLGLIFAIIGCVWIIFSADRIIGNWFRANEFDFYYFAIYFIGVIILLQGSTGGRIISLMGIIAVAYLFLGRYTSGDFAIPAFNFRQIATMVYTDIDQGAFGIFMSIMTRILSLFLMFSALLLATGLGDLIRSASMLAAGNAKGGPAKVAVISSALFGMLSGSPVANVAATGSFTIPLMKSIGYKPRTAAAVETIASTGGSIAPPIMGLSAFVMSEIVGVPYVQIIVWAIIPAFLWYYTTFLYVHYSALTQHVEAWKPPREELLEVFKSRIHLIIAIVALVYFLIHYKVAEIAALYAVITLFIASFFRKVTRLNWEKTKKFLFDYAKIFSTLCVLNTMLGIFTGAFLSTGMHTKIIMLIFGDISNWFVVAVITFILCIIFGMLVPPFAAYITVVLVAVPILSHLGFSIPVIHMFVLFNCALAPITPPVALAAYTAATIADADPIQTAKEASLKALPLWIFPFILFKNEVFIGMNTSLPIVLLWTVIMMIGVFIFTLATNKYCFGKISNQLVIWFMIMTVVIMQPINLGLSIIGSILGIGTFVILYIQHIRNNTQIAN